MTTRKQNNNLNIYIYNVNGLGSKLDILEEFVSATPTKLDIVAITETSEKEEIGFLTNTDIEGYDFYHTSSITSKGGTAIYVNKRFNTLERSDLNINKGEFESTWIEIKNKYSKNIVCGSIYRHPHYNCDDFFQYLETCLTSLTKENKEIYMWRL